MAKANAADGHAWPLSDSIDVIVAVHQLTHLFVCGEDRPNTVTGDATCMFRSASPERLGKGNDLSRCDKLKIVLQTRNSGVHFCSPATC